MAVYVDPLFDTGWPEAQRRFPYRQACHMWADTEQELHYLAALIGLKATWAQYVSSGLHYDLTPGMRAKAIRKGAVEVDVDVLVDHMKRRHGTLAIRDRS